jgi:hypothetical protein
VQVFLCYAAEDKAIAEPIAFSIRARGHNVFLDRDDLPPAGEYDLRVERAIETSQLIVFLVSPASTAKGRYTLSELEFARRKWRTADGHVLPVMVQPTPMEDLPSFLKSVTILDPKGNIAAEVASAVGPIAQRATQRNMMLFGSVGAVTGLASVFFAWAFDWAMPEQIQDALAEGPIDFGAVLSSSVGAIAFSIGLVVAFAYLFKFQSRLIAIVLFVLAGSFISSTAVMSLSTSGTSNDEFYVGSDDLAICSAPAGKDLDPETQGKCDEQSEAIQKIWEFRDFWTSTAANAPIYAVAGAFEGLILAWGVSIATGRTLSLSSGLTITLVSTIVTVAVFLFYRIFLLNYPWIDYQTLLEVPWQTSVAAFIGRSIRD